MVLATVLLLALVIIPSAVASPPHPDLWDRMNQDPSQAPYYWSHVRQLNDRGINQSGQANSLLSRLSPGRSEDAVPGSGDFRILALLVEFSDKAATVAAGQFDSLIFSNDGKTVRDYYREVSYGQIDIVSVNLPSQLAWKTAPQTYAYYVDGQNGIGNYPQNTQGLVEDLVDLVDPQVDFAQYDNDGDGQVDLVMVIHAGSGAEFTGSDNDIWSHEWAISPRQLDGVSISTFTIQPEFWIHPGDMTIGVCCHELGHAFGLPDLYDTDYSSHGIGKWGLMALGTWLGPRNMGGSPAHLCAWSKTKIGILDPTNPTHNLSAVTIENVEENAVAYRLWQAGADSQEYFLIENRQKVGYDAYLPGSGLLIWHIDESRSGNYNEWYPDQDPSQHALVALEQADGYYRMEQRSDAGNSADPFPGATNNTSFNALSSPSSDSYTDGVSFVAVDNIAAASGIIMADLTVGLSSSQDDDSPAALPANILLAQNYPNPFNPTTTISFSTAQGGAASLVVYNALGQTVATVLNGQLPAGEHTVAWSARNSSGESLPTGIYYYRLTVGDANTTRKMLLVR
ncbi:MAG: M6 family metalloprotease domain-containing protein [bacterium]